MEGVIVFQGTVMVDRDSGKIYLVTNNYVTDLNDYLAKEDVGEEVTITIQETKDA